MFRYMATCHAKIYSWKVQQVSTISLTLLQYNAVPVSSPAINAAFMKLIMFSFCLDCVREVLIWGYDNF